MNYRISLASCCLVMLALAAPYTTAQPPRTDASAAVIQIIAAQQLRNPDLEERIYKGKEVDKKPVIKSKPQPYYNKEADGRRMDGTVVLRCIFASSGKVTNIHVIGDPPPGLKQSAIEAASLIKFKPAEKDGKPVSMWIELQYKFQPR